MRCQLTVQTNEKTRQTQIFHTQFAVLNKISIAPGSILAMPVSNLSFVALLNSGEIEHSTPQKLLTREQEIDHELILTTI
jgi:hypothetical protein